MVRMIALIRVKNLSDFNSYRQQVPATLEPYGGEIRFRAEKPMTLDDENGLGDFSQIALFWFPTADAMTDWHESDEYHDLLELRASAGTFTIIGVDPDSNCA
jgi:uncharacterized protein (DUF1330 family)